MLFLIVFQNKMPSYKVTYFAIKGLGEPIRFILSQAGVDFVDDRVETSDWPKIKPSKSCRNYNFILHCIFKIHVELLPLVVKKLNNYNIDLDSSYALRPDARFGGRR